MFIVSHCNIDNDFVVCFLETTSETLVVTDNGAEQKQTEAENNGNASSKKKNKKRRNRKKNKSNEPKLELEDIMDSTKTGACRDLISESNFALDWLNFLFNMLFVLFCADAALEQEVQKMKDERTCKVCMDSEVNVVFLKCGHLVCCSDCAPALRHCPICREGIRGTIRVFIS